MGKILLLLGLWLVSLWAQASPPALLLARAYEVRHDPAEYWVSEKYDGVRAYWDGRQLRFRSGALIAAPEWFVADFPERPLDGELWLGRGRFDTLSAMVRRQVPVDAEWRQIRYLLFELPHGAGTFTERIAALEQLTADLSIPWLQAAPQFRVADPAALQARLAEVLAGGGEGLMLHRADAPYLTGRSEVLLKWVPEPQAEATVVGHVPGKGALRGMLGALRLRTPEGIEFRVGSGFSETERRNPPPLGSQVTYRYRELTAKGVPRFPVFIRRYEPL